MFLWKRCDFGVEGHDSRIAYLKRARWFAAEEVMQTGLGAIMFRSRVYGEIHQNINRQSLIGEYKYTISVKLNRFSKRRHQDLPALPWQS